MDLPVPSVLFSRSLRQREGAVTGQARVEILGRLVDEVPGNDEVLGELADQLLADGRIREAAAYYRQALEVDDDDPEWTEKLSLIEAILNQ